MSSSSFREIPHRTKIFISYSHRDKEWLDEIQAAVTSARVAVLLVSPDFLASDFINKAELPQLLRADEDDGARILPLLVNHSRFATTWSPGRETRELVSIEDVLRDFHAVSHRADRAVFIEPS